MKKFEVGKTYWMRSVCDHNCVWYCEILSRTAKFVTLKTSGYKLPSRVGISFWDNAEHCSPLGRYSMSPLLRAENEVEFLPATLMHLKETENRRIENERDQWLGSCRGSRDLEVIS